MNKHDHSYGEGYYDVQGGKRVKHIQTCLMGCGHRLETPVDDTPKAKGPSVSGLSSGERLR